MVAGSTLMFVMPLAPELVPDNAPEQPRGIDAR